MTGSTVGTQPNSAPKGITWAGTIAVTKTESRFTYKIVWMKGVPLGTTFAALDEIVRECLEEAMKKLNAR